MLEDIGDADDQAVPLPNVSGRILEKGTFLASCIPFYPTSHLTLLHILV